MIGTRRGAREWARRLPSESPVIDVLIPTARGGSALSVTLAGLAAQDDPPFQVIVSDQADEPIGDEPSVAAMLRVLEAQGRTTSVLRHLPRRGLAEQRQFLLDRSTSQNVLFLDDDVWIEPGMLATLHSAITELDCGFVGAAVQGISYLDDDRPDELTSFEPWSGPVRPERVRRGEPAFERWRLHNAANLAHLAAGLDTGGREWLAYRVAWIGGCVLYRRSALIETGGFDFWQQLPAEHVGEDVAAQWRVMQRYGGAGIVPSGAVHLEAPTTIPHRDIDAPDVLFTEQHSAVVGGTPPNPPVPIMEPGTEERREHP